MKKPETCTKCELGIIERNKIGCPVKNMKPYAEVHPDCTIDDNPKFEPNKFIVINRKVLEKTNDYISGNFQVVLDRLVKEYEASNGCVLNQKYYVCNQDEPYADEVLKVILEGERDKLAKTNVEKICNLIDKKYSDEGGHQNGVIECILCGAKIDYFVSTNDGYISFDCQTENCISGGSEDLVDKDITNTQQGPPTC